MPSTIPASYAQSAIRLLARPRAQLQALLSELDLPGELLDEGHPRGRLSAEQFGRLFVGLVRMSQHEVLQDAEAANQVVSLSTYRLMFAYMLQATDLQDAIRRAALFFLRFNDRKQSFTLTVEDTVVWRFALPAADEGGTRIRLEHFGMGSLNWLPGLHGRIAALYIWHRLASWLIGSVIDLEAVRIDLPRGGHAIDASAQFGAPVYFGQPGCSLAFHPRYLAFPLLRSEAELNRMLATFPAELMRMDELHQSLGARVRALLGADFSRELPGLEQVADRLHMTAATLHRRLQSEGVTFQKIKDHCRRDAAIGLLGSDALTGAQIAERLGFSDASAFVRAFRKWTGRTPAQFRAQER